MDSLLELFCHVDDFCKAFLPHWNKQLLSARRPRGRRRSLCISEIMTILIHFHQSNYRNFYLEHVMTHLRNEFPGLVSYNRFVELIPSVIVPLTCAVPAWAHAQVSPSLTLLRLPCARIHVSIITRPLPDLPDAAKHPPDGSMDSNYI
jgi:hypothetical protein